MGNIGDPLTEGSIPAVGTSGTTYASELNDFLTEVKDRLEALVPKTSLDDGALDMNGYPVQNASYVGLADQAEAPTTPSNSFQAYNGNVYWVNTGGAVQLTDGTGFNLSLAGTITGDYGGVNPAQFRFVDADQEYYAYDDYGGGAWARVWARNFDIAAGATSAFRVRLAYGGGSSYTLTLPATLPASTSFVGLTSSGTLTTGATFTDSITMTGNIVVTGAISATSDVTGGDLKYTTAQKILIPAACAIDVQGASHTKVDGGTASGGGANGTFVAWELGNNTDPLSYPVTVREGDHITQFVVYLQKSSSNTSTITAKLYYYDATNDSTGVVATVSNNLNAPGSTTLTSGTFNQSVTDNLSFTIKVSSTGDAASERVYHAAVYVKRP